MVKKKEIYYKVYDFSLALSGWKKKKSFAQEN